MIDLELMAALVRAMPDDACLWLLGDRDQLMSVEAGGVLAELVARGSVPPPPALAATWAARLGRPQALPSAASPGAGPVVAAPLPGLAIGLTDSYRAKDAPWVLELAGLARPGAATSWSDFTAAAGRWPQVRMEPQRRAFHRACQEAWRRLAATAGAWTAEAPPDDDALRPALAAFQLLCGTNAQVEAANRLGHEALGGGPGRLMAGTPVLVTANRATLDLANGDIGIALGSGLGSLATAVRFPGTPEPVPLLQLPPHQPAFALTIHKSQGSEWRTVAIDLTTAGDLVGRHLLYTALTRASSDLWLCTAETAAWAAVFA
jgi:exodeoxyribonuclease V alpha subunit